MLDYSLIGVNKNIIPNKVTYSRETFASNNPTARTVIRTFAEILCAI